MVGRDESQRSSATWSNNPQLPHQYRGRSWHPPTTPDGPSVQTGEGGTSIADREAISKGRPPKVMSWIPASSTDSMPQTVAPFHLVVTHLGGRHAHRLGGTRSAPHSPARGETPADLPSLDPDLISPQSLAVLRIRTLTNHQADNQERLQSQTGCLRLAARRGPRWTPPVMKSGFPRMRTRHCRCTPSSLPPPPPPESPHATTVPSPP